MKLSTTTSDKISIDTNIVIYAIEDSDTNKTKIALEILKKRPYISNQVITETINVLQKKFKRSNEFCIQAIIKLLEYCYLIINTEDTYYSSSYLMKKYKFSLYDSIIVANALLEDCSILYTEDMYEIFIDKKIKIINPFKEHTDITHS